VLGGQGEVEERRVLAGVGIEDGSAATDIPGDLASGTNVRSPEKDVVLEQMDQAGRFVGFVLGTRVDSGDDVHQGNGIPLEQEDAQAVVQGELFLRGGCRPDERGEKQDRRGAGQKEEGRPLDGRRPPFRLPFDHVSARVYFILSLRREKAIFVPAGACHPSKVSPAEAAFPPEERIVERPAPRRAFSNPPFIKPVFRFYLQRIRRRLS